MLKRNYFPFSLPSSHFIVSSPIYELSINYESILQSFNHIYESLSSVSYTFTNCLKLVAHTGLEHSLWQFKTRRIINKFQTDWNPTLPLGIHSRKWIWICLLVFCEMAAILSRGKLSLFHGPHTFARDWLAQDSAVCRTWTSVEQSIHYRTDPTLIGLYVDHSWYTPTELRHRDGCRCPGVK